MWLVILGGIFTILLVYVVHTLWTSSGSYYGDTSLDAFIVQSDEGSERKYVDDTGADTTQHYHRTYKHPGRQVLLLYGTEYGFSEQVARTVFDRIDGESVEDKNYVWQPRLVNAKDYSYIQLKREQLLLVIISTAGHGVPPTDAREFYDWLMQTEEPYPQLKYSVLAMGDSNYPHFCRTGKAIDTRLQDLGGYQVAARADVDMEDWSVINTWLDAVITGMKGLQLDSRLDYLQAISTTGSSHDRNRPFMATLKVKYDLTSQVNAADKETIHCEFDLTGSDLCWTSGDALGIYPQNNPADVTEVLHVMGWSGEEDVKVPDWSYKLQQGRTPLRLSLLHHYDLKAIKPELMKCLRDKLGTDTDAFIRMTALLNDGLSLKKNVLLQEYLAKRELIDIMEEFDVAAHMTVTEVLSLLKPLQPRYYSISSSPQLNPTVACVTAAVVRYSSLGRDRTGVCTTFLQDRLQVHQTCPVFISKNPDFRLPSNKQVPVIMIGPGTGLAPFRAFIQERETGSGQNFLYFGCRHKMQDFLYREELERWEKSGDLTLRTAFSRDQQNKVYVQDRLAEDAKQIWKLIEQDGAHIYVCGDAAHMAHDVHSTLVHIINSEGATSLQMAQDFLLKLEECGRYQKDVWVT